MYGNELFSEESVSIDTRQTSDLDMADCTSEHR